MNDREQKGIKTELKEKGRRNYHGISSCSNINPYDQIDLILSDNLDFPIPMSYHNLN